MAAVAFWDCVDLFSFYSRPHSPALLSSYNHHLLQHQFFFPLISPRAAAAAAPSGTIALLRSGVAAAAGFASGPRQRLLLGSSKMACVLANASSADHAAPSVGSVSETAGEVLIYPSDEFRASALVSSREQVCNASPSAIRL